MSKKSTSIDFKTVLANVRSRAQTKKRVVTVDDVVALEDSGTHDVGNGIMVYPQERPARQERLAFAATKLKERFVGIDEVIDSIITKITYWYLYPERSKRPPVISLWGMTGVGKTDLVRNLKDFLGLQGAYAEIAMHNGTGEDMLADAINSTAPRVSCGEPGIIVVDEFQRFRTKDSDGDPVRGLHYRDLWQILSDGILLDDLSYSAIYRLMRQLRWEPGRGFALLPKEERDNAADNYSDELIIQGPGDISVIEMLLGFPLGQEVGPFEAGLPKDVDVLMYAGKSLRQLARALDSGEVPFDRTVHGILSAIYTQMTRGSLSDRITTRLDFTKALVFVIGNLDSLYLKGGFGGSSIPADFLRRHTQSISVVAVKETLSELFFPEQVARLGNVHIIYPSLSQEHFRVLAERSMATTAEELTDLFPHMTLDPSILELVIRNGVYPDQGVRPLFTTANEVSSEIAAVLHARFPAGNDQKGLVCQYDLQGRRFLLTSPEGIILESPYEGDKDRISRKTREDAECLNMVAIHEAGHALVGYCTTGVIPEGIVVQHGSAFNILQDTRRETFSVKVGHLISLLAGAQAVRLLLGSNALDAGHENDLQEASTLVVRMVRNYGMADDLVTRFAVKGKPQMLPLESRYSYSGSANARDASVAITNTDQEAWFINNIISKANQEALAIVTRYTNALNSIAEALRKDLFLDRDSIKSILNKNRVKPNTELAPPFPHN